MNRILSPHAFLILTLALPSCATELSQEEGDPSSAEQPTESEGQEQEDPPGWCDEPSSCGDSYSIVTAAPLGIGAEHLGRPVTVDFNMMTGPGSGPLFPVDDVFSSEINSVDHRFSFVENSLSLAANFKGWGVDAAAGVTAGKRFASFRAERLNHALEINDTASMKAPPEDAYFYISRIFYGHSYEAVVQGDARNFNLDVRAEFEAASGGINVFAERNRLSVEVHARGLSAKNGAALFSRTAEEIESNYETGEEAPILVEYRSIPRRNVPVDDVQVFDWFEPNKVRVRFDKISVFRDGSLTAGTWSMTAACQLNGKQVFLEDPAIWSQQGGIRSNCTTEGPEGPDGTDRHCDYPLFWDVEFNVLEGDRIECGLSGQANSNDQIPYSQFEYQVGEQNQDRSGTFEGFNADTEYRLHYSLDFEEGEEAQTPGQ